MAFALDLWMNYGTAGAWWLTWIIGMIVSTTIAFPIALAIADEDFDVSHEDFWSGLAIVFCCSLVWFVIVPLFLVAGFVIMPMYLIFKLTETIVKKIK